MQNHASCALYIEKMLMIPNGKLQLNLRLYSDLSSPSCERVFVCLSCSKYTQSFQDDCDLRTGNLGVKEILVWDLAALKT